MIPTFSFSSPRESGCPGSRVRCWPPWMPDSAGMIGKVTVQPVEFAPLTEALFEQIHCALAENAHVVDPVVLAGLDCDRALANGTDHGDAGVAGGVAVAAAGGPCRAGLAE